MFTYQHFIHVPGLSKLWLPPGLNSCLNFVFLLSLEGQHIDLGLWGHRLFSCSLFDHCLLPTVCNPRNCSMPGFPILHHLLVLAPTHVHRVSDTTQPSHPLSSPSLPDFNLSQHQCLGVSKISWIAESGLFLGPNWKTEWRPIRILPSMGMQSPSLGGKGWLLAFFSPQSTTPGTAYCWSLTKGKKTNNIPLDISEYICSPRANFSIWLEGSCVISYTSWEYTTLGIVKLYLAQFEIFLCFLLGLMYNAFPQKPLFLTSLTLIL